MRHQTSTIRRTRGLAATIAAATATLGLLVIGPAAHALPSGDPGDPGDPSDRAGDCVAGVSGSIRSSGSTFGGPSTLSWSYTQPAGCRVVFRFGSETVGRAGSRTVDPSVTRSYGLQAVMLGVYRSLDSTTVVVGDVVLYKGTHPGARASGVTRAEEIVDAMPEVNRRRLVGKEIELHLVPDRLDLTDLPPWWAFRGQSTPDGRPYDSLAGAGGTLRGASRIVMAVDEKEIVRTTIPAQYPLGFVLAHEMGHTVDGFALSAAQNLRQLSCFGARRKLGGPWLDPDTYSRSASDEYYANATAAIFSYPHGSSMDYSPSWLYQNDRCLYDLVDAVYGLR